MSVRAALRLTPLLETADETWCEWTSGEPLLAQFSSHGDVARWRRDNVDWQEDREVLLALGRLTLTEEPRVAATAVLVSLVLPACEVAVANRAPNLRDVRHLEQVAAGYLWGAVAEYPWDDPLRGWIPQGIARRVGRALDREFGWGHAAEPIWRERHSATPEFLEVISRPAEHPESLQNGRLYWWALTEAGISREDLDLLVALAVTASRDGITSRGSAGLTARTACLQLVGPGQTADQLQYRARKALKVLRTAARTAA